MFITTVCLLFLLKLKWPKNKSVWESIDLWKKVNYSLIDEGASWLKYGEELDEKKSLSIVNSASANVLVARDRGGLGVSDKLADILSDWLDTIESVADGDILLVTFAMMFSDAGKDENNKFVGNLANYWQGSAVLHSHCS